MILPLNSLVYLSSCLHVITTTNRLQTCACSVAPPQYFWPTHRAGPGKEGQHCSTAFVVFRKGDGVNVKQFFFWTALHAQVTDLSAPIVVVCLSRCPSDAQMRAVGYCGGLPERLFGPRQGAGGKACARDSRGHVDVHMYRSSAIQLPHFCFMIFHLPFFSVLDHYLSFPRYAVPCRTHYFYSILFLQVTASTGVQTALGLGGLLGTWFGGYWGQRAYNYRGTRSFMPLFMGTAAALGAFPFWLLLNLPSGELGEVPSGDKHSNDGKNASSSSSASSDSNSDHSGSISGGGALGGGASWSLLMVYVLTAFVTGIIICMVTKNTHDIILLTTLFLLPSLFDTAVFSPVSTRVFRGGVHNMNANTTSPTLIQTGNCVRSMVQNTTLPHTRGAAFALFNLSDDLGRGLGPLAVKVYSAPSFGAPLHTSRSFLVTFNFRAHVCHFILLGLSLSSVTLFVLRFSSPS